VRLVVVVEISEWPARSRLADDEARIVLLLDDPRRRETARGRSLNSGRGRPALGSRLLGQVPRVAVLSWETT